MIFNEVKAKDLICPCYCFQNFQIFTFKHPVIFVLSISYFVTNTNVCVTLDTYYTFTCFTKIIINEVTIIELNWRKLTHGLLY